MKINLTQGCDCEPFDVDGNLIKNCDEKRNYPLAKDCFT